MIQDARVLQDEFIPKEVGHRNQEMNELSRALDPVTRNEPAETVFLYGPSGAGKTCLARFALDRLRETVLDLNSLLCRIARRHGFDAVISIESEATDSYDIGNPPLHPRMRCES